MNSEMYRVARISLVAGVKTAVVPLMSAHNVAIGNASPDDIQFHTTDANDNEYLVIAAGYERQMPTNRRVHTPGETAFWLKATQDGTAVVIWF